MTDLTPITALGGKTPADQRIGALRITENAGLGLASLALRRGAVQPAPMGLDLPGPGEWAEGQGIAALWTGPDQWMVEFPGRATDDVAADLTAHAPGCSVTEQTDGWVAFEIEAEGPEAIRALLERLVNIDAGKLAPGCATRTLVLHMGVFVIRRAPNRLAVIGMRGMAGSLWHGLTAAAHRQAALAGQWFSECLILQKPVFTIE